MSATATPSSQPKPNRIPLQPKNFNSTDNLPLQKTKPQQQQQTWFEISLVEDSNKENTPISSSKVKQIEPFDSSLAEELSAIRKRLERLRFERENTEKLLKERELVLDREMKEIEKRAEMQKEVELEVEKLATLNQLQSCCLKTPAIQSLRDREEEKKNEEAGLLKENTKEENKSEAGTQPPADELVK